LKSSKELVHSGEIYVVSPIKHKTKARVAFLFDHQLIICKKVSTFLKQIMTTKMTKNK